MLACLSISRVQLFVMDAGRIYHPSSSTSKSWPNTAAIGSPLNTDYRIQKSSQRIADSMFNYLLPSSLAARFLRLSVRARSLSTITHYPKEFLFPRRFEPCKNPPSEIYPFHALHAHLSTVQNFHSFLELTILFDQLHQDLRVDEYYTRVRTRNSFFSICSGNFFFSSANLLRDDRIYERESARMKEGKESTYLKLAKSDRVFLSV